LDNLSFYVHSIHWCDMHMKMSFVFFDLVVVPLCMPPWSAFFFLHVSTLWFVIPQFVQCLSIFLILLCVFAYAACLVLCGTNSTFFAFVIVIPSSNNIATSLCCYNVDNFILIVQILGYDCKPVLNTIVRKLYMVGICKPWVNFWICS
jgi:hypothetical protein